MLLKACVFVRFLFQEGLLSILKPIEGPRRFELKAIMCYSATFLDHLILHLESPGASQCGGLPRPI